MASASFAFAVLLAVKPFGVSAWRRQFAPLIALPGCKTFSHVSDFDDSPDVFSALAIFIIRFLTSLAACSTLSMPTH